MCVCRDEGEPNIDAEDDVERKVKDSKGCPVVDVIGLECKHVGYTAQRAERDKASERVVVECLGSRHRPIHFAKQAFAGQSKEEANPRACERQQTVNVANVLTPPPPARTTQGHTRTVNLIPAVQISVYLWTYGASSHKS